MDGIIVDDQNIHETSSNLCQRGRKESRPIFGTGFFPVMKKTERGLQNENSDYQ
jgi:hypothetical protein